MNFKRRLSRESHVTKKQRKFSDDEDETGDDTDNTIFLHSSPVVCTDTEAAILYVKNELVSKVKNSPFPPVVFVHQLFDVIRSKTVVNRQIVSNFLFKQHTWDTLYLLSICVYVHVGVIKKWEEDSINSFGQRGTHENCNTARRFRGICITKPSTCGKTSLPKIFQQSINEYSGHWNFQNKFIVEISIFRKGNPVKTKISYSCCLPFRRTNNR